MKSIETIGVTISIPQNLLTAHGQDGQTFCPNTLHIPDVLTLMKSLIRPTDYDGSYLEYSLNCVSGVGVVLMHFTLNFNLQV